MNLVVYASILEKINAGLEANDFSPVEITQMEPDSTLSKWRWKFEGRWVSEFDSFEDALASFVVYLVDE